MNRKYSTTVMLIFGPILIGVISLLAGCSSSSAPATTPAASPKTAPSPTPVSSPTPAKDVAVLRAKGEEIFQKTAGGVGCKACHGTDGKGGNLGPDVRGKTADEIKRALGGDAMSFIRLSNDDIEAVVAYMKSLESQR